MVSNTKKVFAIFFILVFVLSLTLATRFQEVKHDIPSPLSPSFVQKVSDCGKLDLIDRASPKYNPNALIDGLLKECDF